MIIIIKLCFIFFSLFRIRKGREGDKEAVLAALVRRTFRANCIIFVATKSQAHKLRILLGFLNMKVNVLLDLRLKCRTKSFMFTFPRVMMITNDYFYIQAGELHGNLRQPERLDTLKRFKNGELDILVATDVAARGLDISGVKTVINYDLPMTFEHYIHR
mgnify:FL=1